jgi:anti-sigma regulatory factor (Ser/Thr protein kinase)
VTSTGGFSPFRHDALLYGSDAEYLAGTVPFVQEGLDAGEPVLVAVAPDRIALVRAALGSDARRVQFADMTELGGNPARIIPAWADFLAEFAGDGPVRGIGEPVWAGRSEPELAEAQLHEALLNRAFAGRPGFWLRCPYDVSTLPPEVVAEAHRSHPIITRGDDAEPQSSVAHGTLAGTLPEPWAVSAEFRYDRDGLAAVRGLALDHAVRCGLDDAQARRLVLAVHEAAANSVRHGGGGGLLRIWVEPGAAVCEISDRGWVTDPLAGRVRPLMRSGGGRGVWIINQVCDLVQLRSGPDGTVVRMYQRAAS